MIGPLWPIRVTRKYVVVQQIILLDWEVGRGAGVLKRHTLANIKG
jgi:hypothetical protein